MAKDIAALLIRRSTGEIEWQEVYIEFSPTPTDFKNHYPDEKFAIFFLNEEGFKQAKND